jgi:hypothetical protein
VIVRGPGLLEDSLLVITTEFNRWASSDGLAVRDRLDVLKLVRSNCGHSVAAQWPA